MSPMIMCTLKLASCPSSLEPTKRVKYYNAGLSYSGLCGVINCCYHNQFAVSPNIAWRGERFDSEYHCHCDVVEY